MNSEFRIQNSESNGGSQFAQCGFQIIESLVGQDECDLFSAELTPLFEQQQKTAKNKIGGVRNLLRVSSQVLQFAKTSKLNSLLEIFSGKPMFPVRAIFFDKTAEANWLVPWHQDLAIAVVEKIETDGFTAWSNKDDTLHVHPPREILESMITVRLHLDDCKADNGALKVISGSHLQGKLPAEKISRWTSANKPVVCVLSKGGALFMRPLILHASAAAAVPSHRRILHIEFAAHELPNGLKWFDN